MNWTIENCNEPIIGRDIYYGMVKDDDVVCIQSNYNAMEKTVFFHNLNIGVDCISNAVAYWRVKSLKNTSHVG
jgi:hypothetical protein